ncbi:Uma2 family endonuclease [Nocardia callitridis]|uniref:Uma2 family endonuclease n=1 Tax=Nocardia callitridis TaxID=648753 RepID=A0ABP9JUQ8_9NOCA
MTVVMYQPDHLLTLEEWIDMPQDSSRGYELVEGVLVVSPRPVSQHQRAIWRFAAQLEPQLPPTLGVLTEVEVIIESDPVPTVRVPDLLVVPSAGIEENRARWNAADVLLAVEVLSLGSKRTDRITKFAEYAEAGIEHYWLVDLDAPASLLSYHLRGEHYEPVGDRTGRVELDLGTSPIRIDTTTLTSNRAS